MVISQPKVMVEINGQPFLEILIKFIHRSGFRRIILCTGYKGETIKNYFENKDKDDLEIVYSQEARPLGTGGAIKNAEAKILSGVFFVLNGDSFVDTDISNLIAFHQTHKADISMTLVNVRDAKRFGAVKIDKNSRVVSFEEKNSKSNRCWINAGIYLVSKDILNKIPPNKSVSLENDILNSKLSELKIFGMPVSANFIDIGVPKSFIYIKKNYQKFFEGSLFTP